MWVALVRQGHTAGPADHAGSLGECKGRGLSPSGWTSSSLRVARSRLNAQNGLDSPSACAACLSRQRDFFLSDTASNATYAKKSSFISTVAVVGGLRPVYRRSSTRVKAPSRCRMSFEERQDNERSQYLSSRTADSADLAEPIDSSELSTKPRRRDRTTPHTQRRRKNDHRTIDPELPARPQRQRH